MIKEIKSNELTVKIDTLGAEIKSVKNRDGVEFMWEGNPDIWSGTAPVMFPICGGLKDDKFTFNGKEYTLTKHGFAKLKEFETESITQNSVTFLLKSDADTLKSYPFEFEFRVFVSVDKNTVTVTYAVKNLNDGTMYFSVGAHEAYATPEGIEAYDIVFDKCENLDAYELDGNLLTYSKNNIVSNSNTLALDDKYFTIDALVFKEHLSNSCTLTQRGGTRRVKVEYDDFRFLLLWHKHLAKYICIEPWNGIPDLIDADGDITHKFGITPLGARKDYSITHKITFSI